MAYILTLSLAYILYLPAIYQPPLPAMHSGLGACAMNAWEMHVYYRLSQDAVAIDAIIACDEGLVQEARQLAIAGSNSQAGTIQVDGHLSPDTAYAAILHAGVMGRLSDGPVRVGIGNYGQRTVVMIHAFD